MRAGARSNSAIPAPHTANIRVLALRSTGNSILRVAFRLILVQSEGVVDGERLPGPRFRRRPGLRWRRPEVVRRWKPERQQADGTEVQAARRDVRFADAGLVAAETDAQPAVGVERPCRFNRSTNDGGQRAANLRRRDALGECMPQRGVREEM